MDENATAKWILIKFGEFAQIKCAFHSRSKISLRRNIVEALLKLN
jgi:hypothetical protein